jgi:hypothetical protein
MWFPSLPDQTEAPDSLLNRPGADEMSNNVVALRRDHSHEYAPAEAVQQM